MMTGLRNIRFVKGLTAFMLVVMLSVSYPAPARANAPLCTPICCGNCNVCEGSCIRISAQQRDITIQHIIQEFIDHRRWLVEELFQNYILPALMLFAEQMTTAAMAQVMAVGAMLDAKHQLETQRLFQQLMAEAHKDYHPSEGMCTFGTVTRALAATDRKMDVSAVALSSRVLQRELLSGATIAANGRTSDFASRIRQFINLYCNQADNGQGLQNLCPNPSVQTARINNDINYTATFENPLTLQLDFTPYGDVEHAQNSHGEDVSADEEDLFALAANLYAHNVAPTIPPAFLTDEDGNVNESGVNHYMNIRAIAAKRSVARNSFASIAALKTQGREEAEPYLYAIMREFGISDMGEIYNYLGNRPSYYAQMEILTKKLYQHPNFYTELYDKPANVARKTVAMQAIELMQRRDIYRSMLRSEAILSVMLETALIEPQEKVTNELSTLTDDGELVTLP